MRPAGIEPVLHTGTFRNSGPAPVRHAPFTRGPSRAVSRLVRAGRDADEFVDARAIVDEHCHGAVGTHLVHRRWMVSGGGLMGAGHRRSAHAGRHSSAAPAIRVVFCGSYAMAPTSAATSTSAATARSKSAVMVGSGFRDDDVMAGFSTASARSEASGRRGRSMPATTTVNKKESA